MVETRLGHLGDAGRGEPSVRHLSRAANEPDSAGDELLDTALDMDETAEEFVTVIDLPGADAATHPCSSSIQVIVPGSQSSLRAFICIVFSRSTLEAPSPYRR